MATTSTSYKFDAQTNPENNNQSTPNLNFNTMGQNNNQNRMNFSQQLPLNPNLMSQDKFYNNIYTNNANPIFFNFKERSGKLKWKEIMRIDLENMIKSNDISHLETYLENLIFSEVKEDDVEIITENTTVKLIKIYQHILEYLLHTQIKLENENKMLETNYSSILSDSIMKENSLKENKSMIGCLKKDKREKEMILNTYKCIIDEYKTTNLQGTYTNVAQPTPTHHNTHNTRRNPHKLAKSMAPAAADVGEKKYYYCGSCAGKKFSSEEYLQSHIKRRHGNINDTAYCNPLNTIGNKTDCDMSDLRQSKRDYVKNLEFQVDELKGLFKNFMNNNNDINNQSLSKLVDNQKVLENKIVEVKSDKDKLLNVMEENFKTTLIEIKEFVKNNNQNNFSQENFANSNTSNSKNLEKEKEIKDINNNLSNINEVINEIKNNQNKKIDNVHEEIRNIKSSFSTEIRDLKITKNSNNSKDKNNNNSQLNQNFQSFSDAKNFKNLQESVEIPKISNNNIPNTQSKNNPIENKNSKNQKNQPRFNAHDLESDFSNEDIEEEITLEKREKTLMGPQMSEVSYGRKQQIERNAQLNHNTHNKMVEEKDLGDQEIHEKNISELEKAPELMRDIKGNIINKQKSKELQENEFEQENKLEDALDISTFTKEKNELRKSKEIKSHKKNDEHEIILDTNSQMNTPKNAQNQNVKEKENQKENEKINTNTNENEEGEINYKRKNENKENKEKDLASNNSKSEIKSTINRDNLNLKENEIKINDLKNDTFSKVEVKEENVENVRSRIMDQIILREEMFKNADVDYKNIDKDCNGYKRVL